MFCSNDAEMKDMKTSMAPGGIAIPLVLICSLPYFEAQSEFILQARYIFRHHCRQDGVEVYSLYRHHPPEELVHMAILVKVKDSTNDRTEFKYIRSDKVNRSEYHP